MNSQRKLEMSRQILAIRDLQKLIAEQARLSADLQVARQEETVDEYCSRLEEAKVAWGDHLASGRLMPEFLTALSDEVIDHETSCQAETQKLRWVQREHEERKQEAAVKTGLRKQAADFLMRAQRKSAAEDQERAQSDIEDRTAFHWRQR